MAGLMLERSKQSEPSFDLVDVGRYCVVDARGRVFKAVVNVALECKTFVLPNDRGKGSRLQSRRLH